jgi:hypothetical protein
MPGVHRVSCAIDLVKRTMLLILIACVVGVAAILWWAINLARETPINVEGIVVDKATGKPVAGARVVICARLELSFMLRKHFYATTSDDSGKFSLNAIAPWCVHRLMLDAAAPGELYGTMDRVGSQRPIVATGLRLELTSLPSDLAKHSWTYFDIFNGRQKIRPEADGIDFIGERWELRTPQEIELGRPAVPTEAAVD